MLTAHRRPRLASCTVTQSKRRVFLPRTRAREIASSKRCVDGCARGPQVDRIAKKVQRAYICICISDGAHKCPHAQELYNAGIQCGVRNEAIWGNCREKWLSRACTRAPKYTYKYNMRSTFLSTLIGRARTRVYAEKISICHTFHCARGDESRWTMRSI